MLAMRGVRLRANNYFWGVCFAVGAAALLAFSHSAVADDADPGKSTSQSNSARLEAEIQSLHEELASTKELLREAASSGDEVLLAQRGDAPARADKTPADPPTKPGAKSTDDKKLDTDAWRSLDRELARKWRPGPGGPGPHPGMRGFHGAPPMWARGGFGGGPPWAHHHRHGRGGHGWAHHRHHGHHHHGHHHHGHRHGAHHRHHGGPGHWAHHQRGHGEGGPPWARRGEGAFGPGPRGGEAMLRLAERLNRLERKIDALAREVRGTHEGPGRGGPMRDGPPHDGPPRDGPPHDGPPRDGPPRDGAPRDAAPPRRPGD